MSRLVGGGRIKNHATGWRRTGATNAKRRSTRNVPAKEDRRRLDGGAVGFPFGDGSRGQGASGRDGFIDHRFGFERKISRRKSGDGEEISGSASRANGLDREESSGSAETSGRDELLQHLAANVVGQSNSPPRMFDQFSRHFRLRF